MKTLTGLAIALVALNCTAAQAAHLQTAQDPDVLEWRDFSGQDLVWIDEAFGRLSQDLGSISAYHLTLFVRSDRTCLTVGSATLRTDPLDIASDVYSGDPDLEFAEICEFNDGTWSAPTILRRSAD